MRRSSAIGEDFGLKAVSDDSILQQWVDRQQTFLFLERREEDRRKKDFVPTIFDPFSRKLWLRRNWHKVWSYISTAFRHDADILICEGNQYPHAVYPQGKAESPTTRNRLKRWRETLADKLKKSELWIKEEGHPDQHAFPMDAFYMLHQEIGAWALLAAINETAFRHPGLDEDEMMISRCRTQTCHLLVLRFYAFAESRRKFHELLRAAVGKMHATKGIDERRSKLLWRTLIWPIATRNHWTYEDVLVAERLFFSDRPAPQNPQASARRMENMRSSPRTFEAMIDESERDWYERALKVFRPDRDATKAVCKKYGLLVAERRPSDCRRRTAQEPKNVMSIFRLPKLGLSDYWLP